MRFQGFGVKVCLTVGIVLGILAIFIVVCSTGSHGSPFKIDCEELGSFDTSGESYCVQVNGDHAYLTDTEGGLYMLDITNRSDPVEIGNYSGEIRTMAVTIEGDTAYLLDQFKGLIVLDITDRSEPIRIGDYDPGHDSWLSIVVTENTAYLGGSGSFLILDITALDNITLISEYELNGSCHDIQVVDELAYIAHSHINADNNSLLILDVSDPAVPEFKGEVHIDAADMGDGGTKGVHITEDIVYVAFINKDFPTNTTGLAIIDIRDPGNPVMVRTIPVGPGKPTHMSVKGSYLYVADLDVLVFEIGDPLDPKYIGRYTSAVRAWDVVVEEDTVYVANRMGGLTIVQCSILLEEGVHPSDYDLLLDPSPLFLTNVSQNNPYIEGNLIAWEGNGNDVGDIFLFDLDEPDFVRQISINASDLDTTSKTHLQYSPVISGRKVIWIHNWWTWGEEEYNIRMYDADNPVPGGELLFNAGEDLILDIAFSGNWIVWSTFSDNWEELFSLHVYDTDRGQQKLFDCDGDFALDGDTLVYQMDPMDQVLGHERTIFKVYDLSTGSHIDSIEIYGDSTDMEQLVLSGDHLVWQDDRDGNSDSDIYLLYLNDRMIGPITTGAGDHEDPWIHGDRVVWTSGQNGMTSINMYSIEDYRTAVLSENESTKRNPRISGDRVVWESWEDFSDSEILFIKDISDPSWANSPAVFWTIEDFFPIPEGGDIPLPRWETGYEWKWKVSNDFGSYELKEVVVDANATRFSIPCYEVKVSTDGMGASETETVWLAKNDFGVVDSTFADGWESGMFLYLSLLELPVMDRDNYDGFIGFDLTHNGIISVDGTDYDCYKFETDLMWPTFYYSPDANHIVSWERDGSTAELRYFRTKGGGDGSDDDGGGGFLPGFDAGTLLMVFVGSVLFSVSKRRDKNPMK